MYRLPNFSALRAFEAAARHGNFSRAAEELHLTHGAISHQVRKLEEELGLLLFLRNGRHVTVTPQGRQFALVLGKAFTEIATAAQALRPAPANTRLTITAIPRLRRAGWRRESAFHRMPSGIEVLLQTSGALQDLEGEGIDVGIRFGRGHYPGLLVQPLMGDVYYPVCSPHYRGGNLPVTPAELAHATLLRSLEPWRPWLAAAGLPLAEPVGGVLYEDLSMLIRSAIDGDGVALVRHVVALQEVAAGRLVRLFDMAVPCADAYYLVSPPAAAQREPVRAFRAWLGEEIAAFQAREAPILLT